ncbi:MAG: bifunctional metallophosphatase/5'-nucleotidase [Fimbriimonadaceae bacterium]
MLQYLLPIFALGFQKSTVMPWSTPGGVRFNLIQLNDIYEITPLRGEGGMAKVATVYQQMRAETPNTFVVVAGDFFSPSALGTAKVDGERLAGKQMVACMNAIPVKYVTFGNHEFDVNEEQFKKRMGESQFTWVSSNVTNLQKELFPKTSENKIEIYTSPEGQVRVGYFGITINSNPSKYVSYSDYFEAAKKQVTELRPKVDVLIAITHLSFEDDLKLASTYPEIDMIIGGHEHESHRLEIGNLAGVYKADANAKSAFIHEFSFDPSTRQLKTRSTLKALDADIPEDPTVKMEVDKWVELAFAGFRKDGFEPGKAVANVTQMLDGKETSVRSRSTALTDIIARGMLATATGTQAAIYNGGSIRIDDVIPPGTLTEYDVIRILPFGGKVCSVEMKGSLLSRALDQGLANRGKGGYLQTANIKGETGHWQIGGVDIDPNQLYKVAISDFLLTGNEQGLEFLKRDNPDMKFLAEHADIRNSTIAELKRLYP